MKIIYIDMDGVTSDFEKAKKNHPLSKHTPFKGRPDKIIDIYKDLDPIEGSIQSINKLFNDIRYEVYFLSTPPWDNPEAWTHKRLWIEKYFGNKVRHKLILSARKDLNIGDFLIDDSHRRGQPNFKGEWLEFGSEKFPNWKSVLSYLEIT